jgi:hypothetical protein
LSTTNSIWIYSGANPGLRGVRPTTNPKIRVTVYFLLLPRMSDQIFILNTPYSSSLLNKTFTVSC